jgi:hypothetical protein
MAIHDMLQNADGCESLSGLELPTSEARSSCLPTLQNPPSGALAEAADSTYTG